MIAIAKIKFRLNLLLVAPLAASLALITSLSSVQSQIPNDGVEAPAQLLKEIPRSISSQPSSAEIFSEATLQEASSLQPANLAATDSTQSSSNTIAIDSEDNTQLQPTELTNTPFAATNATGLNISSSSTVSPSSIQTGSPEIAQVPLDPGTSTRGGSSYVGIAGNIGLSGDTALGDGNFAIISKIGLTRSLAFRPGVVLGNDATFLIPLTYEFSIREAEALEEVLPIAPYVGAGVIISTGSDDNDDDGGVGLLLTGGIDIPLNRQFTANAGLNVGIADETDIGLSVGVGYNFSGLGL
ncbi:MAG: hypothetical protein KME01_06175 [Chroococcus sp. CMT-3BRIN-NPC107]|nr:hypothetical protein [Chroococcus sp. CMT-3BRIN-NPC107]